MNLVQTTIFIPITKGSKEEAQLKEAVAENSKLIFECEEHIKNAKNEVKDTLKDAKASRQEALKALKVGIIPKHGEFVVEIDEVEKVRRYTDRTTGEVIMEQALSKSEALQLRIQLEEAIPFN